jgi:poly(3-hydroxybutyrate) depolymerase
VQHRYRFSRRVLSLTVAGIAFVLASTQTLGQPGRGQGPGRGFAGFGQGGGIPFAESNDPRVENRTYHFEPTDEDLPYCVFASSKVSRNKKAPLIVSLHGLGIGPGFMCQGKAIDLAEEGGYILVAPMGFSVSGWYGSPVLAGPGRGRGRGAAPGGGAAEPEGPSPEEVARYSEQDVMNVLAMIREEYKIDAKRTYLMGHSMGGAGTYFLGSKHADQWAAIAPIAPASFSLMDDREGILEPLEDAGVAIMDVHGDMDELVPVDISHQWVETMKEMGMDYEYVEVPGATHGSVIEPAMDPIFAFFAKHKR